MNQILEILKQDARITPAQISAMTGRAEKEIADIIEKLENDNIILGYKPLINTDKTEGDKVTALIELKVTPSAGEGFDAIASQIYCYEQVNHLYLMSGAYDLAVFVEGNNIKEVAMFVSEHLSQMNSIISTSTHFMLKTYKRDGVIFERKNKDTRQLLV